MERTGPSVRAAFGVDNKPDQVSLPTVEERYHLCVAEGAAWVAAANHKAKAVKKRILFAWYSLD